MPGVRCYPPNATFYLFPNVTAAMQAMGLTDVEDFRRAVLYETGVSVCSRVHFGRVQPGETRAATCASPTRASTRRRSSKASGCLKAYLRGGTSA